MADDVTRDHRWDVAVEAAARAWFDRQQATRRDADRFRPDGRPWQWDDLTDHDRTAYRALVAPIVTAAFEAVDPMNRPGPDPDGGLDLDDDEMAAFLAAAKGRARDA